jgi:hypothetical protein
MAAASIKEGKLIAVLPNYDASPTDYNIALYALYLHSR